MTTRTRKSITTKLADVELDQGPGDVDPRPADEKEQGGAERTVAQAKASAAAEEEVKAVRSRKSRRADVAAAQAAPEHPLTSGKVDVAAAAKILRCYESEVASVEKTDKGFVATTKDNQHYLLAENGAVWLEHPEQGLVQAAS